MQTRLVRLDGDSWHAPGFDPRWVEAVEDGKVLYFPQLAFALSAREQALLGPALLQDGVRNISLDASCLLKGVAGDPTVQADAKALVARFAALATHLVNTLFPKYRDQKLIYMLYLKRD